MTGTAAAPPGLSIVIPTYNRRELLGHTLAELASARGPAGDFEVIVADDGSGDGTAELIRSYRDRLRLRYFVQEDQGYRVARARNEGARMASAPVLAFIDAGVRPGPGFAEAHLAAHQDTGAGRLVVGYAYGYNPYDPCPGLAEMLAKYPAAEVVRRMEQLPSFRDVRHDTFAGAAFDLTRLAVPWMCCWTVNISVRAEDFWAVGGFDEDFRSWGGEDLDLGYRLGRLGLPMAVSRQAWVIETPHERDMTANHESSFANAAMFLAKNPEPVVELFWGIYGHGQWDPPLEHEYRQLLDWQQQARHFDVLAELDAATRDVAGTGARVAVFGCGGDIPPWWASGPAAFTLVDFDHDLLDKAAASGSFPAHHAVGLRINEPDASFDRVVITSRLAGLWGRWEALLRTEADRIGRDPQCLVHTPGAVQATA